MNTEQSVTTTTKRQEPLGISPPGPPEGGEKNESVLAEKSRESAKAQHSLITNLPILLVIFVAFAVRLRFLTLFQFHIDEFFTLAAAKFIAETGLPRYPTGLLYDPGLIYSYISGGLFWLFGFSEALGRWPAVIFGVLAVVTVYKLGATVLRSRWVGVLAALWLAISLESVEWSGRVRMITLAQWLGLLAVLLLWWGLTRNSTRYRLGFAVSYGLTLLTHFSTVVLMPAWFVAGFGLWWMKVITWHKALLRDIAFLLVVFALAISSGVIFQPPPSVEFQTENQGIDAKVDALGDKFLQIPSDLGHGWEAYGPYFFEPPHGLILIIALVGLIVSLVRWRRGKQRSQDIGVLFLGCIFITVMAVLVIVIAPHWQRSRYLLMQAQGVFLLLGAHGCREVVGLVRWPGSQQQIWRTGKAVGLASLLTLFFWPPLEYIFNSGSSGWNRYDQAFGHVRDNLSEGDEIMTMHPPAGLIYLDQSDYYLVQSSPKLIVRPDGQLGDRYSGALWLETAEDFNAVLADDQRVWLVTQEFWLFNSYDGYLQQQILWQMDKLWGEGGVWALASRPGARPLAKDVAVVLDAEFDGGARLHGYTADPPVLAPGAVVNMTLFWQGSIPFGAKVLVHLRDADNNTIAQADHFIYDNKVPSSRWPDVLESETVIRDGAVLRVPPELPRGNYRLLVGFYHPQTFERLGVLNDQSGESAIILGEWTVE